MINNFGYIYVSSVWGGSHWEECGVEREGSYLEVANHIIENHNVQEGWGNDEALAASAPGKYLTI